eukprot:6174553-Pleurochrysis_carterae.AAC.2
MSTSACPTDVALLRDEPRGSWTLHGCKRVGARVQACACSDGAPAASACSAAPERGPDDAGRG